MKADGVCLYARSDGELSLILVVVAVKGLALELVDAVEVSVRIEHVGLQLDERHSDVAAVVGHALIVREQIVEDEAELQRADALLQAADVAALELVAQAVPKLPGAPPPPGAGADGLPVRPG